MHFFPLSAVRQPQKAKEDLLETLMKLDRNLEKHEYEHAASLKLEALNLMKPS